jgi:predicted Fe-S protein YdhL (DUF1289 family)
MSCAETLVESPCKRVCVVDPGARLCIGCGRSLDESGRWIGLSSAERSRIMAQLSARLAALDGANATAIVA